VNSRVRSLADLPIYADDLEIGEAVLGRARAREWREFAPLLEGRGLPKIDALHGGRYVPAVARFYGVARPDEITSSVSTPPAMRGVERPEALCQRIAPKRRG
jgi:hypothetical protein